MLDPVTFTQGLFQFGIVLMAAFLLWQMFSSGKNIGGKIMGLVVLGVVAVGYYYPHLLGMDQ